MSSDDFEFDFERFAWVGIDRYYTTPTFEHTKGTIFEIELVVNKPFEEVDIQMLPSFMEYWTYGEDKYIKPFKLIEVEMKDNSIKVRFETVRKSKKFDEIKILLIDVVSILDISGYEIYSLKVNAISQ
ncbi:hypothetical protein [Paenibacillus qinlingensis]|uniref:hypothetical protein n=1 Tax=Paenibacillus qinlingensis TaxID=1837343 RepID=UPI0015645C04|nr:hypothetical protein [Paenibacillus qinlingensis]NQX63267.1 hypothetical protein [Paenibacillus qinlingensis]